MNLKYISCWGTLICFQSFLSPLLYAQVSLDSAFPAYKSAQGVSGNLKSIGSDTMNNLMANWVEGFKRFYPNVKLGIEGKGSSSAPPALINGSAQFGPMSRPMKEKEIDEFEKRFGYKPVGLATSIDMLAVYVNKDNPIKGLTLAQVDAIFSKSRKAGYAKDVVTWGELGLARDWAKRPISLYGRNSASGTYGYFKEHVMANGDFKDTVKEQPGTSAVVTAVANDKYAIGYGGIGYKTADVIAVSLATAANEPFVPAVAEHAYSREYPLARLLLVYLNAKPGTPLDPLRREFVFYLFSKQGQEDVVKDGYLPVTPELGRKQLKLVGLKPSF